jgi:hypothetical protein
MDIPLRVGLKAGANGGSGFERRVDFQLVQQRVVHGITIRVATQMRGDAFAGELTRGNIGAIPATAESGNTR